MASNIKIKELAEVLQVLANPIRLKILALLALKPRYPYELSKKLKISYPLVHLHLSVLEKAGLVESDYVPGPRTKRVYRMKDFELILSPKMFRQIGEELEAR